MSQLATLDQLSAPSSLRWGWPGLLGLALAFTAINACKPLLIDDGAYNYFARQFAHHPLDPYGFAMLWYDHPEPANEVLAPPVLPAWWGLSRVVLGERPILWKLALAPWALLLTLSFYSLARRFCPGMEWNLTVLTLFSPALLPSFNLMLDLPALALILAALATYFRACDENSLTWAVGAGFLAGIACQTKYTAFLLPGVLFLVTGFYPFPRTTTLLRRWLLWLSAVLVMAHIFITWEALIALLYGRSHFFLAAGDGGDLLDKFNMLPFLFSYLGGAGSGARSPGRGGPGLANALVGGSGSGHPGWICPDCFARSGSGLARRPFLSARGPGANHAHLVSTCGGDL